jgi:TonB-linked SusC/RagA family outer membrane protein
MVVALPMVCAQANRTITGMVTDSDDGSPIAGASVFVNGANRGGVSQANGTFSVVVPGDAKTLVVKFIGKKSQEITLTAASRYDVVLQNDEKAMSEVIVVGYGVTRKEANTGSIGVIGNKELKDLPEASFDKMLSGKIPGLVVTGTSGQPGAATEIRIRGTSSINAGNDPLYVVDGIPLMSVRQGEDDTFLNTSNPLSAINPNDIESITVLKDAAAASIYGSRAANGVVLITTKSGQNGKSEVKVRLSAGVSVLSNDNDYGTMTPQQLVQYMRDAVTNAGYDPNDPTAGDGAYYVPKSLLNKPQTNWLDAVTRKGNITELEASVAGGTAKTKHHTSVLYNKSQGVFYGIDFEKMQLRSNLEHEVSKKFSIGTRINVYHSKTNDVSMQNLYYANPLFAGQCILPWTPVYNANGTYNLDIPENSYTNPLASAKYDDQWEKQMRIQATASAQYKFTNDLIFRSNNSFERMDAEGRRYWSKEADYYGNAVLQVNRNQYQQFTTSNTLTYNKLFNQSHSLTAILGQEAIHNEDNTYYINSPSVDPEMPYPNTGIYSEDQVDYAESEYNMASFFGIMDYNYEGKYYLKLSLRTDGSSKFGPNNRWGTFYSVGGSWNATSEEFLKGIREINVLKLRASYGINGNDNIGNYEHWGLYSSNTYNGAKGMYPESPGNPDLTWEENRAFDIGVDYTVLDRISGSLDFYSRNTENMLLDYRVSYTSGFSSVSKNIGSINNSGVEFLVNVNVLDDKDLKWDLGLNLSHNRSKILNLGGEDQIIDGRLIYKVGESLYNYYIREYAGVNPANGEALWVDKNGRLTNDYASAPKKIMGSPEPKLTGGFSSDLRWKDWSFSANFEFKYGNKVLIEENRYLTSDGFNWGCNQSSSSVDYWKAPGDIARNPKPVADNSSNSNGTFNSRWMYDGSFLRIKNVTLSYQLPKQVIHPLGLGNVRVYGSAVNLFTFHRVDFFDPERGAEGMGFGIYPMTKSLVAGLEVTF